MATDSTLLNSQASLLLTGKEAAQTVKLCEKSLYLAVRRGELRAVKLGRSIRYRLTDLQAWVDSKVTAGPLGK